MNKLGSKLGQNEEEKSFTQKPKPINSFTPPYLNKTNPYNLSNTFNKAPEIDLKSKQILMTSFKLF